jgi:hypothetical protein
MIAARGRDSAVGDPISDLRTAGAEFADHRDGMAVDAVRSTDRTFTHPSFGRFDVSRDATRSATTNHTPLVMRPGTGTENGSTRSKRQAGTVHRLSEVDSTAESRCRTEQTGQQVRRGAGDVNLRLEGRPSSQDQPESPQTGQPWL